MDPENKKARNEKGQNRDKEEPVENTCYTVTLFQNQSYQVTKESVYRETYFSNILYSITYILKKVWGKNNLLTCPSSPRQEPGAGGLSLPGAAAVPTLWWTSTASSDWLNFNVFIEQLRHTMWSSLWRNHELWEEGTIYFNKSVILFWSAYTSF